MRPGCVAMWWRWHTNKCVRSAAGNFVPGGIIPPELEHISGVRPTPAAQACQQRQALVYRAVHPKCHVMTDSLLLVAAPIKRWHTTVWVVVLTSWPGCGNCGEHTAP